MMCAASHRPAEVSTLRGLANKIARRSARQSAISDWAIWVGNMALRLLDQGHELVVTDVSKESAQRVPDAGTRWGRQPRGGPLPILADACIAAWTAAS